MRLPITREIVAQRCRSALQQGAGTVRVYASEVCAMIRRRILIHCHFKVHVRFARRTL